MSEQPLDSIDTASRRALHELIDTLREVDRRWASPEWNLHTADDVVGAHRALMHYLQWGLVGLFERDPAAPRFHRIVDPDRKLLGDNPDAVYFDAPISADHAYRVTGETKAAAYVSVTVESGAAWGSMDNQVVGVLNDESFDIDVDGRFEILLGGEPRQSNWLALPEGAGSISTRHYFEDATHAAADPARIPAMRIEAVARDADLAATPGGVLAPAADADLATPGGVLAPAADADLATPGGVLAPAADADLATPGGVLAPAADADLATPAPDHGTPDPGTPDPGTATPGTTPPPRPSDASVAAGIRRVAALVRELTVDRPPTGQSQPRSWISRVPNVFPPPGKPGDLGLAAFDAAYAMAPFLIGPDEALVIRARWPQCRYANVCLWNRHLQTFDYASRSISLNRAQTVADTDPDANGRFTAVISHTDPGTPNWLDTEGRPFGIVYWRFMLPEGEIETPQAEVIPLSELSSRL